MKYETIGGQVTRGETYAKIIEQMKELRSNFAVMAHLHNTEGDKDALIAKGWLAMEELMHRIEHQVTKLAMSKLS